MKIVFGPVPSRRLGRSLGIDVIPLKTCTYDCIYCQLGPTRRLSVRRRPFRRLQEVVAAVEEALEDRPDVDVLTFSGSGEPTLQLTLKAMIRALKARFPLPVAVLTNGALLYRADVRDELREADLVLPSLDAWTEEMFQAINRPHPGLRLGAILEGLVAFSKTFPGRLWLEVLFVRGMNDDPKALPGLIQWVERIRPDRLHINTVVSTPSEPWALPVERERLEEIRSTLGPVAEIVVPYRREAERALRGAVDERVKEMLRRRPLTAKDLAATLGLGVEEARETLDRLANRHGWVKETRGRDVFYRMP
ncbi:MAG: radical SAM protein [Thermodesulfobacteriota bacterium]